MEVKLLVFRTKMVSERRNEILSEMFHRVHFIEKWGRGIKLILSKEPDAEFSEVGTKFITTFKRKSYYEGKKGVEKGVEDITQKTTEKTTQKGLVERLVERLGERLGEKLGEKLGENEIKILDFVEQNKYVTIPELSKLLKISTTAVENNLAKLKRKKALKRVGPDKGGYWEVIEK